MGDNPEQQFEWALKNGDMDQVKSIVEKVIECHAGVMGSASEMCGSWNFWVRVSPQILTMDPLSVRVRNKREKYWIRVRPRSHWIGLPVVINT